jgi:hypothetical protein
MALLAVLLEDRRDVLGEGDCRRSWGRRRRHGGARRGRLLGRGGRRRD